MNREQAGEVRSLLEAALKNVKGFEVVVGRGSFDETEVTFKVTCRAPGDPSRERKDFIQNAEYIGLQPTDIDKVFVSGGLQFRVSGMATRRSKRPIQAVNLSNGKTYLFPTEAVRRLLAAKVTLDDARAKL